MKQTIQSIFCYMLPFIGFVLGYFLLSFLIPVASCETPLLMGVPLQDAVVKLSDMQLNVRILAQKEDPDIAPGTVLSQIPRPGQVIKQHQPVFLVISRDERKPQAPDLVGALIDAATQELQQIHVRIKQYMLPAGEPFGTIIGQFPRAGVELEDPVMIVYVSSGEQGSFSIMPDFKGQQADMVRELLQKNGCIPEVTYLTSRDEAAPLNKCVVKTQKPLAGTVINTQKTTTVRLGVECG